MEFQDYLNFLGGNVDDLELIYGGNLKLLERSTELAKNNEGLWLEFGTFTGKTINYLAKLVPEKTVYGFDSWEGLPEDWRGCMKKGFFSTGGVLPEVEENVVLVKGWFSDTASKFLEEHPDEKIAFLHIDCDIYSSTWDVLTACHDRFVVGTIIQFDEYYNYPEWMEHEHKAWEEYTKKYNVDYKIIAWGGPEYHQQQQIIIQITSIG